MCGESVVLEVIDSDLAKFSAGCLNIEDCFPDMSMDNRERLITGFCNDCWKDLFKDEEDLEFIDDETLSVEDDADAAFEFKRSRA
jgi:hypothetical protein